MPNVLSPRDLVSRPDNMDETVPHTHNFMHYSHGFNHFHIHPLYHRHYLQSRRQIKLSQFTGSYMSAFENHWHSGPLHILLHLQTINSITASRSDILSNNSCPSSIIHSCPSWLLVSFFGVQNIFSIHIFFHNWTA